MKVRAYITHKLAEEYSDCQDRFCINKESCRIAVSDGMSQSIFPDYWADILSKFYAYNGHCNEEDRKNLCPEWEAKVKAFYKEQEAQGKNPWMLRNSLTQRNGAGATLCGVTFDDAQKWRGHVLGDSCVIEIDLKEKCPLRVLSSEEKAFDCFPDYYDSYPEKQGKGKIRDIEGVINETKILLIASDPFSEFIQKNRESGEICAEMIEQILSLDSHESYCSFVNNWRKKGLHNDDSTLCIIEFDGSVAMNVVHEDNIDGLIEKENTSNSQTEGKEPISNFQNLESTMENAKDSFAEAMTFIPQKQKQEPSITSIEEDSNINWETLFDAIKKELEKLEKKDFKLRKVIKVLRKVLCNYFESKKEK